jgi:hypothetical protein
MYKLLAILAMVLAICQTLAPIPRQTADASASDRQSHKKDPQNKEPDPTATAPSGQAISTPAAISASNSGHDENKQQSIRVTELPSVSVGHDWMDYLSIAFSGALVLIGYFGVRYAKRTLTDIKRQADTMETQAADARKASAEATEIAKKSADAALLSAQAVINSERAWIVVRQKRGLKLGKCQIIGVNKGNTPAEVCNLSASIMVQEWGRAAPPESLDPLYLPRNALTVAGEAFRVQELSFEQCKQQLELKGMPNPLMLIFVEIQYWDAFTDRIANGAKPHVTRSCFSIDPYEQRLRRTAPEWTCHT